jgi:acyl-homoserine-lactone acylase
VTWGQFFVYQGFNDRAGWMHTSGGADVIDEYLERVEGRGGRFAYRYGAGERPVRAKAIALPYRLPGGGTGRRTVTAYFTHHGPVVREEGGRWVSVRLMQEPVRALQQSYLRTKARSYAEFARVMELRTNSSNNTVYADGDGTIAYWHGNFVPRRDPRFDWTKPVDGSDPRTEWQGLHRADEIVHLKNPASGWIQNTNNSPWQRRRREQPAPRALPALHGRAPENPRGVHAVRVLSGARHFTLDGLIAAAYDRDLPAFEPLVPGARRAYDALPAATRCARRSPSRWRRCAAGTCAGSRRRCRRRSPCSGARTSWPARRRGARARASRCTTRWPRRPRRASARGARPRVGAARARLRHVAHAVGGGQPVPAPARARRRRATTTRSRASRCRSRRRCGGRSRRSASAAAHHAARLRRVRQQLRRGGRVRAARAGAERARRRRERRPGVAALRRPGGALRGGRFKEVPFYREDVERQKARAYRPGGR